MITEIQLRDQGLDSKKWLAKVLKGTEILVLHEKRVPKTGVILKLKINTDRQEEAKIM